MQLTAEAGGGANDSGYVNPPDTPIYWTPGKCHLAGVDAAVAYVEVPTSYADVKLASTAQILEGSYECQNKPPAVPDTSDDFNLLAPDIPNSYPGVGLGFISSHGSSFQQEPQVVVPPAVSITKTVLACDMTTTLVHTTCSVAPTATAFTNCGCANYITFVHKNTEPVPDIGCGCETATQVVTPTVTQCTTEVDGDLIRRQVNAHLNKHPDQLKIRRLADAIENRRIESYNFWDPKYVRLFVKRYTKGHPRRSVFLVAGGPGTVGYDLQQLVENYNCWLGDNYALYVVHHRGVGNSSQFPRGPDLWDSIRNAEQYISESYHPFYAFTITNAAKDLHEIYRREKMQSSFVNCKWYVHACSYGTLVAQRFMVLHQDALDGVVLDGTISPNPNVNRNLYDFGHRNNEILKNCFNDEFCKKQIKSNENFISIFRKAEQGKTRCAQYLLDMFPGLHEYQRFIRTVLNYYFEERPVVGVQFAYALGECPSFCTFKDFVKKELNCWMCLTKCGLPDLHPLIYSIIMQSEVVGKRMLIHDVKYRELGSLTCTLDLIALGRKSMSKFNYLPDPWAHEYAFCKRTSVLLLHGRLDGMVPMDNAKDVFLHGNTNLSKIVIFDNEGHSISGSQNPCVQTCIREFFNVPQSTDILSADECVRHQNSLTLPWTTDGVRKLWDSWDWIWCWILWVVLALTLIFIVLFFLFRRRSRRSQSS